MGSCQVADSSLSSEGLLCYCYPSCDPRVPHLLRYPTWRLAALWRCGEGVLGGCKRLQNRGQGSQHRWGHTWYKKSEDSTSWDFDTYRKQRADIARVSQVKFGAGHFIASYMATKKESASNSVHTVFFSPCFLNFYPYMISSKTWRLTCTPGLPTLALHCIS